MTIRRTFLLVAVLAAHASWTAWRPAAARAQQPARVESGHERTFPSVGREPFTLTTPVRVVPDTLPFPPFRAASH